MVFKALGLSESNTRYKSQNLVYSRYTKPQ